VGVKRTFKQSELEILSHAESNNRKNKAVFVSAKTERKKKIKHAFSISFKIYPSKERFIHLHYQIW